MCRKNFGSGQACAILFVGCRTYRRGKTYPSSSCPGLFAGALHGILADFLGFRSPLEFGADVFQLVVGEMFDADKGMRKCKPETGFPRSQHP
jgi:hypothetical protein